VPSATEARPPTIFQALALLLLLVTGCVPPAPAPTGLVPTSTAAPLAIPDPGRPFVGDDILDAMRASRRPGGVPNELATAGVAEAVADAIWTWAGEPWTEIVAGGSCGIDRCTLELSGVPAGAHGEDLYVFSVERASGAVELQSSDLRGFPSEFLPQLDDLARALAPPGALDGLRLTSASWLRPPDEGRFTLHYRAGGQESPCGLDLVLDVTRPSLVDERRISC
jgi:hypothetical protein